DDARRRSASRLTRRRLLLDGHGLVPTGALPLLVAVAGERLLRALDHALALSVPAAALAELLEPGRLGLRQVEPVDGFGEAEVGVDARDHDPRVDRDQLDPDHRDAHVRIDHEPLVEDQVDDVDEAARAGRALEVVARSA